MNNKTKKQYISIGLSLFIIILILSFFFKEKELPLIVPYEQNYKEVEVGAKTEKLIEEKVSQIGPKALSEETIKVSLTVLDKKYDIEIKKDSSLIEVMKKIELESINENKFSFKYTDNYSLGSFITEINGARGTPGKYWIYYVNGELASVGVSNYILKDGDIINWSQEGV
ncbi:MAG: DUF4430 domain-containing protein [Candidatus Pacebacteria bacterium]|nr:DUF4430 domain-containing protein [Candidatus Paceibacterota bacterium]